MSYTDTASWKFFEGNGQYLHNNDEADTNLFLLEFLTFADEFYEQASLLEVLTQPLPVEELRAARGALNSIWRILKHHGQLLKLNTFYQQ